MAMTTPVTLPPTIEKKLSRFGLFSTIEAEHHVILDTLNRNKVLLYTQDIEEILYLLSDRADKLTIKSEVLVC